MNENHNTVGIYLAAGFSRRMQQPKLNLPFQETFLGSYGLQNAMKSQLSRMIVVVRTTDEPWLHSIEEKKSDKEWEIVTCVASKQGQAESIKCGLKHLRKGENAAMILLADQPFISEAMINSLLQYNRNRETIDFVAARWDNIPRPPVIFNAQMFPALQKLQGDSGARRLIHPEGPYRGVFVDFPDPTPFIDIDTKSDYKQAVNLMKKGLFRDKK